MNGYFVNENAACVERKAKVGSSFRPTNYGNETVIIRGSNCVIEPEKCGVPANKVNIGNYKNLKHKFLWKMDFSLSVLFQYIEIFKFSRIDADTMDIKYEMINVISFRDFLDTLFTCMLYVHDDVIT